MYINNVIYVYLLCVHAVICTCLCLNREDEHTYEFIMGKLYGQLKQLNEKKSSPFCNVQGIRYEVYTCTLIHNFIYNIFNIIMIFSLQNNFCSFQHSYTTCTHVHAHCTVQYT